MIGHFARGLQILVQQRRRHGQRLAGIVEAGGIGRIDGKLAGELHVLAGEIADGVVVFGVAQAARQHGPGIARGLLHLFRAHGLNPVDDLLARFRRRRRHGLGRHLLRGQPFHHQRPAGIIAGHHVHGGVGLEIELRGGRLAAVAGDAILRDERPHGLLELPVEGGGRGAGRSRGRNGEYDWESSNVHLRSRLFKVQYSSAWLLYCIKKTGHRPVLGSGG